jgi:hypothetical protein
MARAKAPAIRMTIHGQRDAEEAKRFARATWYTTVITRDTSVADFRNRCS